MSREDRRRNKEKFEKEVLKKLRRSQELQSKLWGVNKYEFTEPVPTLVIIEDTGISETNKKLLTELLDYIKTHSLKWEYDKKFDEFEITDWDFNVSDLPEHLQPLISIHPMWKYRKIQQYYANYLTIKDVPVKRYKYLSLHWREETRKMCSELQRLRFDLWVKGEAFRVLKEGTSAWDKIERKYKRSKNKVELYKNIQEFKNDEDE